MKRINGFIFLFGFCCSCTNTNLDTELQDYIKSNCDFNKNDTCYINLQDVFQMEYDTMYIFDGYEFSASVPLIAEDKHPKKDIGCDGLLYSTETDRVILVRNHKIVKEMGWEHELFFVDKDQIIEKKSIFDGDSITVSADMYTSPVFKVIVGPKRDYSKSNTYLLEPVQQ